MADETAQDDIVLDLTESLDGEVLPPEAEAAPEDSEEFAIEIEGEIVEDEPELVKKLRNEIRERDRELSEHRKAQQPAIVVGDRPTLASCEYDEDRLDEEMLAWTERKARAASQEAEAQRAAEVRNREWLNKVANFQAKAAALPVTDFAQAEETLRTALPEVLQSALLMYAKDPAKVGYALYKHPAKLAALAQEPDPVRFVLQINELERNLKVTQRRKPPAPEAATIQRGSTPVANVTDKRADELLAKAGKTGNLDEYRAYMRSKRAA